MSPATGTLRAVLVYQSPKLPSSRIRILQLAPHLVELGVQVDCVSYPRNLWQRRVVREAFARADVVVLQKKVPRGLDRLWWRRCPAPLVFDFDDAIMFRDKPPYEHTRRRKRFDKWVVECDGLICGNDYLRSQCPPASPAQLVAPSPVPHRVPRAADREPNQRLQIGWIGGGKNLVSLHSIAPALRELANRIELDLVIISDRAFHLDGVTVINKTWSLDQQDQWLSELDVGLMPLDDSPWSRGKCSYKALQYMAAAVPVVASPVGMNASLIRHEQNGMLAEPGEWSKTLEQLASDPAQRTRLGAAGRRTIETEYTYEAIASRWAEFLQDVSQGRA